MTIPTPNYIRHKKNASCQFSVLSTSGSCYFASTHFQFRGTGISSSLMVIANFAQEIISNWRPIILKFAPHYLYICVPLVSYLHRSIYYYMQLFIYIVYIQKKLLVTTFRKISYNFYYFERKHEKKELEFVIHAMQSLALTSLADSIIRGVNVSFLVRSSRRTPAFGFDQDNSIGFKNGE